MSNTKLQHMDIILRTKEAICASPQNCKSHARADAVVTIALKAANQPCGIHW